MRRCLLERLLAAVPPVAVHGSVGVLRPSRFDHHRGLRRCSGGRFRESGFDDSQRSGSRPVRGGRAASSVIAGQVAAFGLGHRRRRFDRDVRAEQLEQYW